MTLKKAGYYKLEVWGAQGGSGWGCNSSTTNQTPQGGMGGYSYGSYKSTANATIYVVVGSAGESPKLSSGKNIMTGGYNGGGNGWHDNTTCNNSGGAGGGATHIALTSGILSSLSSASNQVKVLIVAGGGGGGGNSSAESYANNGFVGGDGGGYSGGGGKLINRADNKSSSYISGIPGNQSSGYSFGKGQDGGQSGNWAGAGGGWYGGYMGCQNNSSCGYPPAGGGSGYINTSKLTANSYGMYCRNSSTYLNSCPVNSSYYTYGTTSIGHAVSNAANTGNGYAKITYLGT